MTTPAQSSWPKMTKAAGLNIPRAHTIRPRNFIPSRSSIRRELPQSVSRLYPLRFPRSQHPQMAKKSRECGTAIKKWGPRHFAEAKVGIKAGPNKDGIKVGIKVAEAKVSTDLSVQSNPPLSGLGQTVSPGPTFGEQRVPRRSGWRVPRRRGCRRVPRPVTRRVPRRRGCRGEREQ